jgi:hypothetical protein
MPNEGEPVEEQSEENDEPLVMDAITVDGAESPAMEGEVPSDVESSVDQVAPVAPAAEQTTPDSQQTILALLQIASTTGRGEFASEDQKQHAMNLITALEASNPTPEPTNSKLIEGCWELVWSDTQLFRSSPFFMAGRAVCSSEEQAQQYDWFCDMHRGALAISTIGAVRQVISSTRMVSEFEVKAGAVPFLNDFTPFAYSGGWPVSNKNMHDAVARAGDYISSSLTSIFFFSVYPASSVRLLLRVPLSVRPTLNPPAMRGRCTWIRWKLRAVTCPVFVKSWTLG